MLTIKKQKKRIINPLHTDHSYNKVCTSIFSRIITLSVHMKHFFIFSEKVKVDASELLANFVENVLRTYGYPCYGVPII